MAWMKAPRGLVDLFDECLPDDPRVERRQMFAYPAAFVNGSLFAGLFQDRMFARLSPSDRDALDKAHGAVDFEPMPGRKMRAYTVVPDEILIDEEILADLLMKALAFATTLPPKEKKARSRKS